MQDKIIDYFKQNDFDYISENIIINDSMKNIKVLYGKKKKGIETIKIAVYFIYDINSIEQLETVANYISEKGNDNLCLVLCDSDLNLGNKYSTYLIGKNIIHFAYINKAQASIAFDFDFHYYQSKYIKELIRFIETSLVSP